MSDYILERVGQDIRKGLEAVAAAIKYAADAYKDKA